MTLIHPTAEIDSQATIAEDVEIGPYAVIGPHVQIDSGTTIGSHVVIEGHTRIGKCNEIFPHATLGQKPQDLKYHGEPAELIIGHHNEIREHVTMHIGTENGGGSTSVGNHNLIMVASHIAHDSHIANHCVLANNVLLAGHITIHDHANIGGAAALHHYVTVGRNAFVAGMARVTHDCPPFMITEGYPAQVRGVNLIGLARHEFSRQEIDQLKRAYLALYGRHRQTNHEQAIVQLRAAIPEQNSPYLEELLDFAEATAQSRSGRQAETHRRDDKRTTDPK